MVFSARIFKAGKGRDLSLHMPSSSQIDIYYFDGGIGKKTVKINGENLSLEKEALKLSYQEVIPLGDNLFLSRIQMSLGVIKYE